MSKDMLGIEENSDDLDITDEDIDFFYADHESDRHCQDRMWQEAYEWQISGVLEIQDDIIRELAFAISQVDSQNQ